MTNSYHSTLALKTCALFLIWLLLSESFDGMHIGMGAVAALGVAWLNTDRSGARSGMNIIRVALYFPWLIVRVLHSGFHLSRLILHPALPIDPKMIRHPTVLKNDSSIVLLSNSITLTPGTITVEADSKELIVHSMDDSAAEDVVSGRMERRIEGLFVARGEK